MPSSAHSSETAYRPSYGAAAIAAGAVFLLYLITLGPSSAMWDTSEYIATAYILGLPHPPGNPFFVLLGRVFTILPFGEGPAMRVNLLAALCSAMSAGLWFLVTEHVLSRWLAERWQRIAGASLAVLIGGTAFTVWSQSVVNEKVYTVALLGVALASWLTIRWTDAPDGRKADRLLVLIAYVLGLGYANHMAGFIPAPAIALAVLVRRPQTILRWRLLLACAGAVIIGMTPFATQPIRAAYFPSINEGEPTGCRTEFKWSCTFSAKTWEAFKYNFNREQFGKPDLSVRQAPPAAQVGMWWTYFRWQWLRDAYDQAQPTQAVLAAIFLVLGLVGGWMHWKKDRQSFWYFGSLMLSLTVVLIFYLNFKYGFSQSPDLQGVDREVRDRDYFYLWSFSAWGVWAALGLIFVWESIASFVGVEKRGVGKDVISVPRQRSWLAASPVLAVALIPLVGNWSASTRRGDTTTRDFAYDMLNSVEPYGILVTAGDNDTFPLWYAQEVEGIRRDVLIANTSLLNTDWYARQMIRAPIHEYDASTGAEMYRGRSWPRPSGSALRMTLDEVDSIPYAQQISDTVVFSGPGEIRARISPRILTKADIAVLAMIRDNPDRPIYFARTIGNYAESLGLGPWLVTQGLARRLVHRSPAPGRDTLLVAGEGYVDVMRSRDLWLKDSLGPKAIIRKGGWPDKASLNIPVTYLVTGLMLSEVLRSVGQDSAAAAILAETKQVAVATRLASAINFDAAAAPAPVLPDSDAAPKTPVPSKRDSGRSK